jgi:hypothetical protein
MGDKIVITITDGVEYTPDFYGHWCGWDGLRVFQKLARRGKFNGMHSMMCNFILSVMGRKAQQYSYYIFNHGETEGMADCDCYTWTFNYNTKIWTSTHPDFAGRKVSMKELDHYLSLMKDKE